MKLEKHTISIKDNNLEIEVAYLDKKDAKKFKRLFDLWKELNNGLIKYGRKVLRHSLLNQLFICFPLKCELKLCFPRYVKNKP